MSAKKVAKTQFDEDEVEQDNLKKVKLNTGDDKKTKAQEEDDDEFEADEDVEDDENIDEDGMTFFVYELSSIR